MAARRAAGLTHNLLTFSRNGSPASTLVNLSESVDLTLQSVAELVPPTMTIVRDYDPDLWNVLMDPVRLGQIVINCVVNARDAMSGSGTLTIRTEMPTWMSIVQALPKRSMVSSSSSFADTG